MQGKQPGDVVQGSPVAARAVHNGIAQFLGKIKVQEMGLWGLLLHLMSVMGHSGPSCTRHPISGTTSLQQPALQEYPLDQSRTASAFPVPCRLVTATVFTHAQPCKKPCTKGGKCSRPMLLAYKELTHSVQQYPDLRLLTLGQ